MSDKLVIRTFTVTIPVAVILVGCTQFGKGDIDSREVQVKMIHNEKECVMEVTWDSSKEITDDSVELNRPGS